MSRRRYWWNEAAEETEGNSPPLDPHNHLNQAHPVVTGRWIPSPTRDRPPPSNDDTLSFWRELKEEAHRTASNVPALAQPDDHNKPSNT